MKRPRPFSGFTLLELMIAITVAGILVGLGVPAMRNFIRNNRLGTSAREMVVDFAVARNEAVSRATQVSVCTTTNMTSCANASWGQARLVFVDGGVAGVVDGTDQILSTSTALDSSIVTGQTGLPLAFFVSFSPQGRLNAAGRITLCITGQKQRNVEFRRSGNVTLDRSAVTC